MQLVALVLVALWSVMVLWRREWRLPALMLALTLEISKTWFIFLPFDQSTPTSPALLDLTRLTSGLIILGFLWKWLKDKRKTELILFGGVFPFLILTLVSVGFAEQRTTATIEVIRYAILFVLSVSVAELFTDTYRARQFVYTIAILGALLGGMGVVEYFTGQHFWAGLPMLYYPRAQATFVDANIYARFLALAFIWTIFWWQKEKHWGALALSLIQLAGLALSFSRGAWLSLLVALVVLMIIKRERFVIMLGSALVAIGGISAVFIPQVRERFLSLLNVEGVLGQRSWLLKAGVDMFYKHPLQGVGIGNYEHHFVGHYSQLLPSYGGTTRSHTTVVTIGAEMGILGLLALMYFIYATLKVVHYLLSLGDDYALPILLSLLVIFLSSQAEGRLFEDPWLWILIGWLSQRKRYARKWLS